MEKNEPKNTEEYLDVLTDEGKLTGISRPRKQVHAEGLFHRAVHVWLYAESTGELLLQKRAACKDSWPGLWDISSAGHISAGDTSLATARRELEEELGVNLPEAAFELLFDYLQQEKINEGTFINNEYNDVYFITLLEPIPLAAFTLQESEVEAVKWMPYGDYEAALRRGDPAYVHLNVHSTYFQLFTTIQLRYHSDPSEREASLKAQAIRYVPVTLSADLLGLSRGDVAAVHWVLKAADVVDKVFLEQLWATNPLVKAHLEEAAAAKGATSLDRLKLLYFHINKGPWSVLDENEPFLTTADSKPVLATDAVRQVAGYEGLQYRAAFPAPKPKGANFYPADMDRDEFELWYSKLTPGEKAAAQGFFTVIRRPTGAPPLGSAAANGSAPFGLAANGEALRDRDLQIVPYSVEYKEKLEECARYLHKAADVADTGSLKTFLSKKADALLSNDYYESDIAWMDLDSPVDITFGPYETYEDAMFGYKATFEAFVGIRDDDATAKVKLFGNYLQELEDNLPEDPQYKQKVEGSSPIRVIQLAYTGGDVKGPHVIAFNLPNDERIQRERGTAMVMLRNVSEAKFEHILVPIAEVVIAADQRSEVNFDAFYTHTLCHECCHGIGPHTITLPGGGTSTVRQELQELHSALEEAKADIVGLWALHYLLDKGLIAKEFEKAIYVSFLAGCFRSIRFGLVEAHGKGQALQFNWILEQGGFVELGDGTFGVDFTKVREAVRSLSHAILTVQAQGNKKGAAALLSKYGVLTPALKEALAKLQSVDVPIDVTPSFTLVSQVNQLGITS